MYSSRSSQIVIDTNISLNSGQEWYSGIFNAQIGGLVRVQSFGTQKFYVAVYAEQIFQNLHKQNPGGFPFVFGTDKKAIDQIDVIRIQGPHRAIVRLGVFTPAGTTRLTVEVIGPR